MTAVPSFAEQSDPAAPTKLRLSSPAEILAAVPYLLGFTPAASFVVICLRQKQVGLTMRIDVDTAVEFGGVMLARMEADEADSAVFILFDPPAGDADHRPGEELMRTLASAAEDIGIATKDALGVSGGRYWSYICEDLTCCPPEGLAMPLIGAAAHSKVAAPFVATGVAPLASREALEKSIAAVTGPLAALTEAAYETALALPAAYPIERWFEAVRRFSDETRVREQGLTTLESVRLVVGLEDVQVRDEVLSWTADRGLRGVLAVLRLIAPVALAPFDAQVIASLAWAAFASGDGALASVALERALRADPEHGLAGLLNGALESGVTPSDLQRVSRELGGVF